METFISRLRGLFQWQIEQEFYISHPDKDFISDTNFHEVEHEIDVRMELFAEKLFGRIEGFGDIMENKGGLVDKKGIDFNKMIDDM